MLIDDARVVVTKILNDEGLVCIGSGPSRVVRRHYLVTITCYRGWQWIIILQFRMIRRTINANKLKL
jgi:hypothetical protein